MRSWLSFLLIVLVATACTSGPTEEARELVFSAEAPRPTLVPPADLPQSPDSDTDAEPPSRLAFSDWTVDELIAALERALDGPTTITFSGQGEETLEIDGPAWRVVSGGETPSASSTPAFVSRGLGDEEWVTYGHVGVGIRSQQAFAAGADGQLLDELDEADPLAQTVRIDRFVLDETSDLASMWVPHQRDNAAFFTPSLLYPAFIEELLSDITVAVAGAETDGVLETTSTETTFTANIPNTDFVAVSVSGDELTLSSQGGWMITVRSGIDAETHELGAPNPRDILNRERLIAATEVPDECLASTIEARELVDDGLVTCTDPDQLITLTASIVTADEDDTE